MDKETYAQLLHDPRWQKKRLKVLERDNWKCTKCGRGDVTLNVHHERYIKDAMPWEYEMEDLITDCVQCHADSHGKAVHISNIIPEAMRRFFLACARCLRILSVGEVSGRTGRKLYCEECIAEMEEACERPESDDPLPLEGD